MIDQSFGGLEMETEIIFYLIFTCFMNFSEVLTSIKETIEKNMFFAVTIEKKTFSRLFP